MNNGGVNTTTGNEPTADAPSGRAKADDFARAVSRVAVAQICEGVGFESVRDSALDSLSDIAIRYLHDIGKAASFYANISGRTHCNVFDIIRALEDLGNFQGFLGASGVGHCLASSGTVMEILDYAQSAEEVPFNQSIPQFPVARDRRLIPSFTQMDETPPGKHVPAWLPALPDPHTYKQTPVWNERKSDLRADKIEQARQRRNAERSLLNLQQRLAQFGSAGASTSNIAQVHQPKELKADEGNPYLTTPLPPGEKEVSSVNLPVMLSNGPTKENSLSVLETFAPAIEAMKDRFCEVGDGDNKVLPEKRPAIHFKFKTGKKVFGQSSDISLHTKFLSRPVSLIGHEEERDDKKRRAGYILKHAMENPQELTQM